MFFKKKEKNTFVKTEEISLGANKEITVSKKNLRKFKRANDKKRPKDKYIATPNRSGNIIDVVGVTKSYINGNLVTPVLKNTSFSIKRGEFAMLYGKSGSGKSTLLNLISGLDRPTAGHVIVCDTNLPYLSDNKLTLFRRKYVSFIFQSYNLLENITGYDNVETGSYLQKDKAKKLDINKMFDYFDLTEVKNKYPAQMSGGQRQRVSILRALAKNSDIIFADEPTGALDEKTAGIVLQILYDTNKKYNTTIVMVSHDSSMKAMANKIINLKDGSVESIVINPNPKKPSELKLG
ncbi:ABC transporter ATP-binding protein [Mycoplasmopsis agassizii]|uniref:ABC transporter ATP-binding protein n=1 Tax=Mycoplasmopsis agassizii TaxID=33922 RepID=A0A1W1X3L7_9BACT|nr:ABC transporter ATP-binding protein [Mycoplasmopsis agassizii]PAF54861.1 ABC transporter ATP-binding protein [Mycoplasmopsis agassizii]PAK21208.1 ABC transporter ATP-binding protein [Mycoplasmopsis agassizii]SMC18559.1 putative ABC transport system ATP-binding protein [Mycoplasmopsis agassizii]